MAEETLDTKKKDTPVATGDTSSGKKTNSATSAAATAEAKKKSQDDLNKVTIASSTEYVINNFMNEKLALIDEDNNDMTNFGMKIITFFIPKTNTGKDFYDSKNAVYLPYSSSVKEIVLEDTLDCIGMRGYIDVYNEGGVLDGILERHNLFYLVINMTDYFGNQSIKYEPYIFEIESVRQVTGVFKSGSRILRFQLVDLFTSILKSHSIASLIRFNKDVVNEKTYKGLFMDVVDYVKSFIKVNTNNQFEIRKDVLFGPLTTWKGKERLNGYDSGLDFEKLIKFSFNKVPRNASIWEALQVFLKDCVTSIKMSDALKTTFASIGDVLIPFFFKEEYSDLQGVYNSLWKDEEQGSGENVSEKKDTEKTGEKKDTVKKDGEKTGEKKDTEKKDDETTPKTRDVKDNTKQGEEKSEETLSSPQQKASVPVEQQKTKDVKAQETPNKQTSGKSKGDVNLLVNVNYGGKSNSLVYRHITLRDFFMPFYLCFSQSPSIVFQEINDGKAGLKSIEPKINDNLQSLQFSTIDKTTVDKRWKNVVFLDTNFGNNNSTMLFFEWFYMFYLKVFLNSEKMGGTQKYISNVIPDFYLYSLKNKVGRATGTSDTFNSMFDEYNSYTFATNTENPVDEALREMGKNIASLVLLNDSYTFSLKGNIRRRPNEIMRLNIGDLANGTETQLPIFTNLNQDSGLYVYVRKVIHVFQGNEYINKIVASKICESY